MMKVLFTISTKAVPWSSHTPMALTDLPAHTLGTLSAGRLRPSPTPLSPQSLCALCSHQLSLALSENQMDLLPALSVPSHTCYCNYVI